MSLANRDAIVIYGLLERLRWLFTHLNAVMTDEQIEREIAKYLREALKGQEPDPDAI